MNVLEHPNMSNFKCPICGTSEDKPIVLIPIDGTEVPGTRRQKARQYHLECIQLTESEIHGVGVTALHQMFISKGD